MNRVIKFRGKRLDNGEWAYGFYNIYLLAKADDRGYDELPVIYNDRCPDFGGGSWRNVSKETVGQYTGLNDINGHEIYEGDIVKIKTLQGIVTWHPNGYFCIHTYKCDISEVSYTAIGDMVDYFHKDLYDDGLEVIGNIFDNPELLEGGAK